MKMTWRKLLTRMHSSRMRTTRSSIRWGGGVAFCHGLLLWSSVMAFWFGGLLVESGLLLWPSSVVAFWCGGLLLWPSGWKGWNTPPEDHTRRLPSIRRPPNQKAITEGPTPPGVDTPGSRHPPRSRHPSLWTEFLTRLWKYYLAPNFVCGR